MTAAGLPGGFHLAAAEVFRDPGQFPAWRPRYQRQCADRGAAGHPVWAGRQLRGRSGVSGMWTSTSHRGIPIEYSARTGKPVSSLGRGSAVREMLWDVLWANRDGSTVIVSAALADDPAQSGVAVVRHGLTTPLPRAPASTVNIAW